MTQVRTLLTHSKVFTALVAAALIFTWTTNAQATHEPANKVAAAGSYEDTPAFTAAGQTTLLLSERLRTSKPTDLILSATAECSILTTVTTVGDNDSTARSQLRFYLEIVTDGTAPLAERTRRVGVEQTSTGPNSSTDDDAGEVVFCDRMYRRQTSGFGTDDQQHKIDTYMRTRNANGFNWFALNVGSGVHTVNLYATYDNAGTAGTATSEGVVGTRTLVIQPVKAKNDENVHETDLVVP